VASVCKIVALGYTEAEGVALLWASDNGVETDRSCLRANTSQSFTPTRRIGRAGSRHAGLLLENVLKSDGTLLLTLNFTLGPEQSKAIEFLGANKKPFLHLWFSVPQAGRLARHFLESHNVKILNVVGSSRETGEPIKSFACSVFEALLISTHV
jgi:hypothetical protein